jgi:O-acetyl-ADP-ribose deacetylase
VADAKGAASIAFPAISTGIFGYPLKAAAEVAYQAIQSQLPDLKNIRLIRMVLWGQEDFEVHKEIFSIR